MSSDPSMLTVSGIPTARGLAEGPVFLYRGDGSLAVPEYAIAPEAVDAELLRYRHARVETARDLDNLIAVLRERGGGDDAKVFECHQMFLEDPTLVADVERRISEERVNVEAAIRAMSAEAREKFEHMNDPYFRERVRDVDDVERRLLKTLTGFSSDAPFDIAEPSVIVADDLTPSETVRFPRECVLGFATNGGSATSHVALLARTMGVPCVSGLGDVTAKVRPGMRVLLDGTAGTVTVNPDAATMADFRSLLARQTELERSDDRACAAAGALRGGGGVQIFANFHPGAPTEGVKELGARGIGLYRSEYLWMNSASQPTEEEQFAAYRDATVFAGTLSPEATITIRTLDVGGDKLVKGLSLKEDNPFLGNRSIRYLLANPDIFRTQLRAILRASAFGRVCLMHPMVSCVEEVREAARLLEGEKRRLDAEGIAYDRNLPVGIMIEVPSAALNAEAFAKYVQFFSIGTNDLVQYTMAASRTNASVAGLYQPTNPSVLSLIGHVIDVARRTGVRVGVCGESASDPILGVLWAAMGAEMLSMPATYIPSIARIFRRLSRADLDEYAALVRDVDRSLTAAEIFESCRAFMAAKIPNLEDILL